MARCRTEVVWIMLVTDRALRVLVLAAEVAHSLGDERVDGYHLLYGLAEAECLPGSSAEQIRAARPAEGSFATAKAITDYAVSHALASGRDRATTADVLFAIRGSSGPVEELLLAAGADLDAAPAGNDDEAEVGNLGPALAAMGSHADQMPGSVRVFAGMAGSLIPYVLLYSIVVAATWDTSGPELVLTIGLGSLAVQALLNPITVRRRARRLLARIPTTVLVPAEIRPLLDVLHIRQFEVRLESGPIPGRCIRLGRRAWVVISGNVADKPESLPFVLWHEMAHLARRDVLSRRIGLLAVFSLVIASFAGFEPRGMAIAVLGGSLAIVGGNWWSELACDRFAVRQAGAHGLHAWAADPRLRRRPSFTHPPLALRLALHPIPA